jgi:hypothetical protein
LRNSAGAGLTVIRAGGHFSSAERMLLRTRSFCPLARPVGEADDRERRQP